MTDDDLIDFFDALFPQGFAGSDVLAEIAPDGWGHSPLLSCFHPSPERVLEEQLNFHRNIEDMRRGCKSNPIHLAQKLKSTMEDVLKDWKDKPIDPDSELTELVALCLWDIFSDNHEVVAQDGRIVDIGSFRGAASFLDGYLNKSKGSDNIWDTDYLRFYLGTIWISGRADLMPVYEMIFKRLKSLQADWIYHFPELHIIDFW